MPAEMPIKNQSGFTLAELLLTVAIIAIMAAIASPSLLRSRIAANEATAISSLQAINRAQGTYRATYPEKGFATRLSDLGGAAPCHPSPTSACLIDVRLARGVKSGYSFSLNGSNRTASGVYMDYMAGAAPLAYDQSGVRLFCSTSDSVICFSANQSHSSVPPDAAQCRAEAPLE
jgi:type IV pilus assembly protein PilA